MTKISIKVMKKYSVLTDENNTIVCRAYHNKKSAMLYIHKAYEKHFESVSVIKHDIDVRPDNFTRQMNMKMTDEKLSLQDNILNSVRAIVNDYEKTLSTKKSATKKSSATKRPTKKSATKKATVNA